ncbi:hypothetical protein LX15_001598 [Streptoalloteichus tenebrarius]|uniref:Uncharacterized protein n=1 Tax=Streptoalloteichus tenebrarius (strain ATCC 17920 / DSM 40477 / JCM 4838 / CBS 697.72 / NBRC 16177 / NCIMB 11028 / NRRL B-12390 / A12253. 1 / ISP 5477) TaxID=1933 RepID=A0ABT1HQY2_STRSD|nr:hypothetical protein [Streptoalloteichus tenebrarius]MCP2257912.1 hypothetical protein [Streptoalloteichus tenebrarius]BFE99723.1 hypothetical protein GCM10020241_13990 [Streptoalloteichus tenebrarius]
MLRKASHLTVDNFYGYLAGQTIRTEVWVDDIFGRVASATIEIRG